MTRKCVLETLSCVIKSTILVLFLVSVVLGMLQLLFPMDGDDETELLVGVCVWVICSIFGIRFGIWCWRGDKNSASERCDGDDDS
jgi:hypothetical protein